MNTFFVSNRVTLAKKRAVAFVAVLAALSVVPSVFSELNLGSPASKTPYDRYLGPMFSVLGSLGSAQPDPAQVEQWVRQGRAFRYSYSSSNPYVPQSPQQTEASQSGDCKAKSLWLADKIDSKKVRFVVGKAKKVSSMNHAWLIWNGPSGWLILDATMFSHSLDPDRISQNEFIPIYSYAPGGKYTHRQAAPTAKAKYGDH